MQVIIVDTRLSKNSPKGTLAELAQDLVVGDP